MKTENLELEQIYLELARDKYLWGMDIEAFLFKLCESISTQINATRVSVHVFGENKNVLTRLIQYSVISDDVPSREILQASEYPKYFTALKESRIISADNALNDPRTSEFAKGYFAKYGVTSVLDASIHHAGTLQGVVCVERTSKSDNWREEEKIFLVSISELISQRLLIEKLKKEQSLHGKLKSVQEALIVNSDYAIATTDENGVLIQVNPATNKLLNCKSDALIGNNISDLVIHPQHANDLIFPSKENLAKCTTLDFNALVSLVIEQNEADLECLVKIESGKAIPIGLTISRMVNVNDEVKGYICTLSDISKRVNIRKSLIKQKARYRKLFDGSGDSVILIKNNFVIDCNEEAAQTFGTTRDKFVDRSAYHYSPTFQPDGEESRALADRNIAVAMKGKKAFFEWQYLRFDKTPFYAEVALTMIENEGDPIFMASIRDISSRKQSELQLDKARKQVVIHNNELILINQLSNKLHAKNSDNEIYAETVKALIQYPVKPRVAIYTVDSEHNELHLKLQHGAKKAEIEPVKTIPINPDFIGNSLNLDMLMYSPDISKDERIFSEYKKFFAMAGLNALVVIPLVYLDKQVSVIILSYEQIDPLTENNLEALHSMGKTVSLALINAERNAELSYIAHHDVLTGLTNRNYFHQYFNEITESGEVKHAALLLLDLDRFKEINDSMGHFTGDLLLKKIGQRLSSIKSDHKVMVSRLGGDEFIILVNDIKNQPEARIFIDELELLLGMPYRINELQLSVDVSIGVALYPVDGSNSHALLRSADVAMYIAKSSAKSYSFYDTTSDIHTPQRLALIAELGTSINNNFGQLFLHYQPKLDLCTQEVTGFEALARWDHPKLGMLSPALFVPLIEVSQSIYQFTEEVLHQALAQQKQWRLEGCDYSVAVNISARNLMDDRLVHLLKKLLVEYDSDPAKLELEVTESVVMQDAYKAIDYLHQISKLGVQLSIDDFGTGYSSLAYLRNLPINKLKLDRTFVMGMMNDVEGESIVQTIISLAKTMKLEVIAEGVEDIDTLVKLNEMKCDTAQGYFICKPNTWDNVSHWLNRREKNILPVPEVKNANLG